MAEEDPEPAVELERLLALLELPECRCPRTLPCGCDGPCDCPVVPAPPCEHVRAAEHGLSLEEWAELLEASDPEGYREPLPPPPVRVLSREARVAVMALRHRAGLGLRPIGGDLEQERVDHVDRRVDRWAGNFRAEGERLGTNGRAV